MSTEIPLPEQFKSIGKYIKKANDLELDRSGNQDTRLVAYIFRRYAVKRGMKIIKECDKEERKAIMPYFSQMITKVEDSNKLFSNCNDEQSSIICENYAHDRFMIADNADRVPGRVISQSLAATFYDATLYFDIMDVFDNVDKDLQAKKVYAAYRSKEIVTAIKEGRNLPPPMDNSTNSASASVSNMSITNPPNQLHQQQQQKQQPSMQQQQPSMQQYQPQPPAVYNQAPAVVSASIPTAPTMGASAYTPPATIPNPNYASVQSHSSISTDAIEHCHFARKSIECRDIAAAKQHLMDALAILNQLG